MDSRSRKVTGSSRTAGFSTPSSGGSGAEPPSARRSSIEHASSSCLSDLPRRNLEISRNALNQIRTDFYNNKNFKSSNKTNLNKPDAEENSRLQSAADQIDEIRSESNSRRYRQAIWAARGHNCGDLSDAAKFLANDAGFSAHVASTNAHGFAVIGDLPVDVQLPDKMENWPDHLAVCDPWANIACAATEYPEKFIAKMGKWEQAGKIIEDADGDKWMNPTDKEWIDAVLTAPKPKV